MSRSNRPPQPTKPVNYTPKAQKAPEVVLDLTPCLVCRKAITDGYYARYGDGGVCNKTCMKVQDAKYPHGSHTEEAFLKKFNLE